MKIEEKKKVRREDLPIQKGKIDIEFIEVDGKRINLTPMNYAHLENYVTHTNCTECGVEFEKKYTYRKICDECELKHEKNVFNSFKLVEWNGEFPLYEYDSTDKYFFNEEDLLEYADKIGVKVEELQLVLCERSSFPPIEIDSHIEEVVHEDWEPSAEFNAKVKEFNDWLTSQNTNTWFPTDKRVKLDLKYNTKS